MKYTVRDVSQKEQGIHDMGDWLHPYPWQWFVGLSFAMDGVSPERAKRLFEKFVQAAGDNPLYFMAVEWHKYRGEVHIHALLGKVERELDWEYGISKILPYDQKLGARFYLSKFLFDEGVDWDFKLI